MPSAARSTIPDNESCKPGDPAFARAQFELIARPKASLDAAVKIAKDAGYAIIDLGADLEGEARDVAADHARLALQARSEGKRIAILSGGELTVTVRGNGRGGPNQEYALALADLLKDTPGDLGLGGRYRRRRRRRRQRDRSRRRGDRSGDVCEDEIARPRPQSLSRQQRRHGVLCQAPAICC